MLINIIYNAGVVHLNEHFRGSFIPALSWNCLEKLLPAILKEEH